MLVAEFLIRTYLKIDERCEDKARVSENAQFTVVNEHWSELLTQYSECAGILR